MLDGLRCIKKRVLFLGFFCAAYSIAVVVLNGSQQAVNVPLSRALKVIASTHSRSAGSASQRGMTRVHVNLAANIDNLSSASSRTIIWGSYSKLSPGQTSDVGLNTSEEIFVGSFAKTGSGSSETCRAAVNAFSAGTGGGSNGDSPVRVFTLDGIKTQGTDCTNTFNPLLFYYPEIALYGNDLFAADAFNDAIDAFPADASVVTTKVSGQPKAGPVTGARAPEVPSLKHTPPLAKGKST